MQRTTLKTLAETSGYSISTISLALRRDGRVKEQTRHEIEELAKRLGYSPNSSAAILAGFKTGKSVRNTTIAVVTHSSRGESEATLNYYRQIEGVAKNRGYDTEYCPVYDETEVKRLISKLYYCGVEGVILCNIRNPEINLFALDWSRFAVVVLSRNRWPSPFDLVTSDVFFSVRECWRQVRDRGYSRIGMALCRHSPPMEDDLLREGALAVCHAELGPGETAISPYLGDHGDEAAFRAWFRTHAPNAVIGFQQGQFWLLPKKAKIPDELGFASLHVEDTSDKISGCWRDPGLEVATAIDHIDFLLRHHHRGLPSAPKEILIRPTWREGQTLRRI